MLTFRFSKADGWMTVEETLTSGMVGKEVRMEFSEDWEGFSKTAVFMAGEISRDVVVSGNVAVIPHEVLAVPGEYLYVGVYGAAADGRVIPTIRVRGPLICHGADPSGDESVEESLPVWAQLEGEVNALREYMPSGGGQQMAGCNELQVLTIGGAMFDSFVDRKARENLNGKLPQPMEAAEGQILTVAEVNADGTVKAVRAVDAPETAATENVIRQIVAECLKEVPIGGFYMPTVSQLDENTIIFNFLASNTSMPGLPPCIITLPNSAGTND